MKELVGTRRGFCSVSRCPSTCSIAVRYRMFILVSIKCGFFAVNKKNQIILLYLKRNYCMPNVKFASLDCHIAVEAPVLTQDLSVCSAFPGETGYHSVVLVTF